MHKLWYPLIISICLSCADEKKETPLFVEQTSSSTNLSFVNEVKQKDDNNVLKYPYYFNGGGVAVGDINNDGLPDIYFTGNQVPNKLYLNEGNFKFKDITEKAGVAASIGWKTGVTMADVNQDGWLDIYVSRSAMGDSTLRKNLLFINNGNLTFSERAEEFGIADASYSTQAAFFDFDKDGDLDVFVLNHSLPKYAGLNRLLSNYKKQKSARFGSKLYQNNNGKFVDISEKAGIINNVISFGLGVAISDLNQDGWPDIYVSNDFNEEDFLYINNHDGTFKDVIREATGHVSLFSMGSDAADFNNDLLPDIITLDMLPKSNERIKLSSGDDNYDKYRFLIDAGFHHQSMRNMLQLNNGDGTFSEIGQFAGISNTDWSWSALFADFDLDGWKDLYISNGYETDYTNMQFLKFTADEQLKAQRSGGSIDMNLILQKMPSIETGNYLFRNKGDLTFETTTTAWGLTKKNKSNGAAYADLDNDGDLDLVINVMNGPASILKNTSNETTKKSFVKVDLRTGNANQNIIGTKVFCYAQGKSQMQEFEPARGFQSAMYTDLVFGLDSASVVDSMRIVWPDNRTEVIRGVKVNSVIKPNYGEAKSIFSYKKAKHAMFESIGLFTWKHEPVDTNDFKRQLLLPTMYSYSGPKIAKGDVNGDGLEDIYLCGAKHQPGALFLQNKNGSFAPRTTRAFEQDKHCQDEDAVFFDADNDHDLDLFVVSGGYLFSPNDALLQDRLYLNDGNGDFAKSPKALPDERNAGSCVQPVDIDADGDLDLFVGSRFVPGQYPISPKSMLLINDGKGHFTNEITTRAPELENGGLLCDAATADLNNDHQPELIVAGEWMPVKILTAVNGKLVETTKTWLPENKTGWWNCLELQDVDGDGDLDLFAGNYGTNNQFNVSSATPATLVFKDFNSDNQVDPFFCYFIDGVSYPYASRDEALGQVSFLRPRFPDYTSYANATIDKIFTPQELSGALTLRTETLGSSYWENTGTQFKPKPLPHEVQYSPVFAIVTMDVDNDGDLDIVMGGNETRARVRIGKSDASKGALLINDGKGNFSFSVEGSNQLAFFGDVRDLVAVNRTLLAAINGGKVEARKVKPK